MKSLEYGVTIWKCLLLYTSENNMVKQWLLCLLYRLFLVKHISLMKYKHIFKVWTCTKDSAEPSQVQSIAKFLKQGLC